MKNQGPGYVVQVINGDITDLGFKVDAIVNAANSELRGGGGVDGAIHKKGGPLIAMACETYVKNNGKVIAGDGVVTTAGNLDADYVIHVVGPRVTGKVTDKHIETLAECYKVALRLADEQGCKSIAFPNISTGIYGFPKDIATNVALTAVGEALDNDFEHIECVYFVCFEEDNYNLYLSNIRALLGAEDSEEELEDSEDFDYEDEEEVTAETLIEESFRLYAEGNLVDGITLGTEDNDYGLEDIDRVLVVNENVTGQSILEACESFDPTVVLVVELDLAKLLFQNVFKNNLEILTLSSMVMIELTSNPSLKEYILDIVDAYCEELKDLEEEPFAEPLSDSVGFLGSEFGLNTEPCTGFGNVEFHLDGEEPLEDTKEVEEQSCDCGESCENDEDFDNSSLDSFPSFEDSIFENSSDFGGFGAPSKGNLIGNIISGLVDKMTTGGVKTFDMSATKTATGDIETTLKFTI